MARIHLLPDTLINQIAAGEVVERPASVVKELVENAIDAGARNVRVRLVAGGRELIEVEDDGSGMDSDDALLALERHGTSKIADAADLDRIATLGFRGEALPSIAAASRLTLETAAADGEGTRVEVEFGRVARVTPCARPRGTVVTVRDIFVRLPARLKFLRSEATELRHSIGALTALAFVRPDVGFAAEHGRRAILQLPPVRDPAQRLPDLVGAARARQARPVRHVLGTVTVAGFLLPPGGARDMVVAVNGRVVRDRILAGAVNRALRGPAGAAEAEAYLHIQLPASEVDVNVHPAKAEVRFADPGRVMSAVTQALAAARPAMHGPVEVRRVISVSAGPSAGPRLPFGALKPAHAEPFEPPRVHEAPPAAGTAEPSLAAAPTPWGRYLGQYRGTYLVLEDDGGLVLIDQHVAHERVLFEALLDDKTKPALQRLLLPEVVELEPALAALALDAAPELEALGLELEQASGASVRVLGVPASLPASPADAMLRQLLADLVDSAAAGESLRERAAASLACQAAIKKNWPLSVAEAQALLADLATLRDPHRCPHGRPIVLRLPHDEIERRIGRR